jgi:hypothetical protein
LTIQVIGSSNQTKVYLASVRPPSGASLTSISKINLSSVKDRPCACTMTEKLGVSGAMRDAKLAT